MFDISAVLEDNRLSDGDTVVDLRGIPRFLVGSSSTRSFEGSASVIFLRGLPLFLLGSSTISLVDWTIPSVSWVIPSFVLCDVSFTTSRIFLGLPLFFGFTIGLSSSSIDEFEEVHVEIKGAIE